MALLDKENQKNIDAFIDAWKMGRVCLHPTDTLPGLTFDPSSAAARAVLAAVKGRPEDKPCLALVGSFQIASNFFAPLPGLWQKRLARLWPGPLSVVWQASAGAPSGLVHADGSIGLRVPRWRHERFWYQEVLNRLALPLPTTSVNSSGERPLVEWHEAVEWLRSRDVYVPEITDENRSSAGPGEASVASTVIRLGGDGTYEILRLGAMGRDAIQIVCGPAKGDS